MEVYEAVLKFPLRNREGWSQRKMCSFQAGLAVQTLGLWAEWTCPHGRAGSWGPADSCVSRKAWKHLSKSLGTLATSDQKAEIWVLSLRDKVASGEASAHSHDGDLRTYVAQREGASVMAAPRLELGI